MWNHWKIATLCMAFRPVVSCSYGGNYILLYDAWFQWHIIVRYFSLQFHRGAIWTTKHSTALWSTSIVHRLMQLSAGQSWNYSMISVSNVIRSMNSRLPTIQIYIFKKKINGILSLWRIWRFPWIKIKNGILILFFIRQKSADNQCNQSVHIIILVM